MKKHLFIIMSVLLLCHACSDNDETIKTYEVSVQLAYPSESGLTSVEGVTVNLNSTVGTVYSAKTDTAGKAVFFVPVGMYEAAVSEKLSIEGYAYLLNGLQSNITVTETTGLEPAEPITLTLVVSRAGQIVIKELYVGGCPKNDGSGNYQTDKYVILYNNSDQPAEVNHLCISTAFPGNAHASNKFYDKDGNLKYADQGFIPAWHDIVYIQHPLTLQSGEQAVIALNGAINHKTTYQHSVDLSNADYCVYDPPVFTNTSTHPAPSAAIPSSNYLKAVLYGLGSAIAVGNNSPAFMVFTVKEGDPVSYATNDQNLYAEAGSRGTSGASLKVPVDWILDGMEVYSANSLSQSKKRLTPVIDGGYVPFTNTKGYSLYRNVDKEATEAIAGNSGKLVYGYSKGVEESTDPSGIDAEASRKNGARIVYQDTNNSGNDFHQRSNASLNDTF